MPIDVKGITELENHSFATVMLIADLDESHHQVQVWRRTGY